MRPEHLTIILLSCVVAVGIVAIVAAFKSRLASAKKEWLEPLDPARELQPAALLANPRRPGRR